MRAIAFVTCLACTGCSFALTTAPPENHRQLPQFNCSTSRLGPTLDIVFSALMGITFISLAGKSDAEFNAQFEATEGGNDPAFSRKTGMGIYAGLGALGITGAYVGWTRSSACRTAKSELEARMQQGGAPTVTPYVAPAPVAAPVVTPPAPAPAPAPTPAPYDPD